MLLPLQLVGPELTGVVVRWGVGDILRNGVGERQPGQGLIRPVNEWSVDHLQDNRGHTEVDLLSVNAIKKSTKKLIRETPDRKHQLSWINNI